ncbi:MAG: BlaI/MecI/CopY family transcriptional regulator [Gemmatimonadota bacterium]
MGMDLYDTLSRLERRIVDAVYRRSEASVADVVDALTDAPSESVRVTMANLEKKGVLTHRRDGRANVYRPTVPESEARTSLMDRVVRTFYQDSSTAAIIHLLERGETGLSEADVAEIRERIERAERARRHGEDEAS